VIFPVSIGTAAVSAPLFAVLLALATEPRLVWVVPFVGFLGAGLMYMLTSPPKRREAAPEAEAAAVS
jgi:hypothetical protein